MFQLYVVDIDSEPGPNFQIQKFKLNESGEVVIMENGDIVIGQEVNKDENGAIIGVNGWERNEKGDWIQREDLQGDFLWTAKPVTMLKGEGVTKQYREEWNTGTTKADKYCRIM